MKTVLNENQFSLMSEILKIRASELLSLLHSRDTSGWSQNERQWVIEALANELCASGFGVDSEPNARGLQIEELIDMVNRPNLFKQ